MSTERKYCIAKLPKAGHIKERMIGSPITQSWHFGNDSGPKIQRIVCGECVVFWETRCVFVMCGNAPAVERDWSGRVNGPVARSGIGVPSESCCFSSSSEQSSRQAFLSSPGMPQNISRGLSCSMIASGKTRLETIARGWKCLDLIILNFWSHGLLLPHARGT